VFKITLREIDSEEDQKVNGGNMYKQILIGAKLETRKGGQEKSWVEESIMEAKDLSGLLCDRRTAVHCSAIEGPQCTVVPSKDRSAL